MATTLYFLFSILLEIVHIIPVLFDIIEEGLKRSTSTTNPSIKYIDAIISSWYKKGFRTVEQINESENGKEITEKKADVKRTVSEPKRKSYQSYSQREYDSSDDFYDEI